MRVKADTIGSNIEMAVVVDVVILLILYPGACGGCAGLWRRNPCHVFPVRQPGRVAGAQSPGHCDLLEWGLWVYLVSEVGAGYRGKESSEGAGVWPGDLVESLEWGGEGCLQGGQEGQEWVIQGSGYK